MPDLSFLQEQANDSAKRNYQKGYSDGYNKAIDDFTKALKPIIDEKIKGWTNSDDLRRWCENSIDKVAEQLKG